MYAKRSLLSERSRAPSTSAKVAFGAKKRATQCKTSPFEDVTINLITPLQPMNGATVADFYERFVVDEIPNIYAESPRRAFMQAASEIGSLKVDALKDAFLP